MERRDFLKTFVPVAVGAGVAAGPISVAMAGKGRSLFQEAYDEFDLFCSRFSELIQSKKIHTTMTIKSRYDNPDLMSIFNQVKQEKKFNIHLFGPVLDFDPEKGHSIFVEAIESKEANVNEKVRICMHRIIPIVSSNVIRI